MISQLPEKPSSYPDRVISYKWPGVYGSSTGEAGMTRNISVGREEGGRTSRDWIHE